MKRFFLLPINICLLFLFNSNAQDVSKLTLPSTPAFSILGVEPASIMRPTNLKSLSTDIIGAFDKNGKLLTNLGLEFSPYWLKSIPTLTREKYLAKNLGQTFLQSFSLSFASIKDSSSSANKFGTGFRFKIFNGELDTEEYYKVKKEFDKKQKALLAIASVRFLIKDSSSKKSILALIDKTLIDLKIDKKVIKQINKEAFNLIEDYTEFDKTSMQSFADSLMNIRESDYKDLLKQKSELLYERKGFIVEFAGASAFNTTEKNKLERIGIWNNISYNISSTDFFTFTSRYMFKNGDTSTNNFDFGLGFMTKQNNINFSLEAMARFYKSEIPDKNLLNQDILRIEKNFTYRFAAQATYAINKTLSLNLSLGKEFDSPFISRSGFFSILGLNYSIFNKTIPDLKNDPKN